MISLEIFDYKCMYRAWYFQSNLAIEIERDQLKYSKSKLGWFQFDS